MPFARFVSLIGTLGCIVGCVSGHATRVPFEGCWTDGAPTDYLVRTAANAIIGDVGAGGARIRALAAVPLVLDSIRAHSQLVTDRAVCARLWRAIDPHDREARLAVVRIGRTYWVRVPGAVHAFDDSLRPLTAIVDL